MNKTNIVLIGFMGVGKTTVGRVLAEKLNYGFLDTDYEVENYCVMKVEKIFENFGEKTFRKLERKVVKECANLSRFVISTGGGIVLDSNNLKDLRKNGVIVLLKASTKTIIRNIGDGGKRPLLKDGNVKEKIEDLIHKREKFFNDYDLPIEVGSLTPDEIADLIIKSLKGKVT